MDDRDSIYLDTISVASEAINRRSLTLSRQTIYHSAEDLYEENAGLNEEDEFDGPAPVPTTKISPAAAALTGNSLTKYCDVPGKNDEVSALLIKQKQTITYSQWKARVNDDFLSLPNKHCWLANWTESRTQLYPNPTPCSLGAWDCSVF